MTSTLLQKLYHKLAQPSYDISFIILLLVAEAILTSLIVVRVPYTEIDWIAYMEEVTTAQNGERDYVNIRGGTGPLVYPAGFLYLYGWLKSLAIGGNNTTIDPLGLDGSTSPQAIRRIQWIFVVLYLFNAAIVLALYQKVLQRMRYHQDLLQQSSTMIVWYWRIAMGITCLSKRIHSIFVLRLFNDAPAMMLLHLSMYLFACCDAWALGCIVFSVAVSIKMNVLLFAPGLLLLLLQRNRSILGTIENLSICALVQLVLGWPFLSTYPISYIKKAFEFDRVFFYKWTVNWKLISEDLFVSKSWALLLLMFHLGTLAFLAMKWWKASIAQRGPIKTREWMCWTNNSKDHLQLSPEYIIYTMFVSNYVGIAFARTLHYQFYCWYFYSLPMLAIKSTSSITKSVVVMFGIEWAFNIFPATESSSTILQLSHMFLLTQILLAEVPSITVEANKKKLQ